MDGSVRCLDSFLKKYAKEDVVVQTKGNSNVLVTVCVFTYNHRRYIGKCLDSILSQKTNFEYEIYLGEDASTDGTREICIEYANKYPSKIRLVLHSRVNNIEINGKPSGRFNSMYCYLSSKCKYFAICEGDDYWSDPYKLQKQVDILEKNEGLVLVFSKARMVQGVEDIVIGEVLPIDKESSIYTLSDFFRFGNFCPTLTTVFRNGIIKDFSFMVDLPIGDLPMFIYLNQFGNSYFLNEYTSNYRVHDGGVWSSMQKVEQFIVTKDVLKRMKSEIKFHHPAYFAGMAFQNLKIAKGLFVEGRYGASLLRFLQSLYPSRFLFKHQYYFMREVLHSIYLSMSKWFQ